MGIAHIDRATYPLLLVVTQSFGCAYWTTLYQASQDVILDPAKHVN